MNINYISINQNKTLIGYGLKDGFIIKDLNNKIILEKKGIEINIIELYYNSNLLFLVENDMYILNIWDEYEKKNIYKLKQDYKIELVRIEGENILVGNKVEINLYNFNLENIRNFKLNNLIIDIKKNYIIYNKYKGNIEILNIENKSLINYKCNDTDIEYIKISNKLKYIAIVSNNGRTIKIYCLNTHILVREYFRGIRSSIIKYIDFDLNDETLLVYSNKNTLHIYKINEINEIFFEYEYSKYRISLKYNNIICIMNELLYIINKENVNIEKYKCII